MVSRNEEVIMFPKKEVLFVVEIAGGWITIGGSSSVLRLIEQQLQEQKGEQKSSSQVFE